MTVPQSSKDQGLVVEKGLRLSSSTEGRFTILDEKNKDSESFDEDSYTDTEGDEFPQFSKSEFVFTLYLKENQYHYIGYLGDKGSTGNS